MEKEVTRDENHPLTFHGVIESTVQSFNTLWNEMGFEEKDKKYRLETAVRHVKNLMDEMLAEEESIMAKLTESVKSYNKELNKLCEELSVPCPELPDNMPLMKRKRTLQSKVEALRTERKGRMMKYEDLHSKDAKLCEHMAEIPYYVASGTVPSMQQLKELESHVNRLMIDKDKRKSEYTAMKIKICALYSEMESEPETSFAHDVFCEDADDFTLSVTKMKELKYLHDELLQKNHQMKLDVEDLWDQLKALWSRLETPEIEREAFALDKRGHGQKLVTDLKAEIASCEELKLQNIHKFIEGIRNELLTWWDKCFCGSNERNNFTAFYEVNFTEELLVAHEKELERLRKYYSLHRDILEKIACREELFKKMVEFDAKASDPNRFFNDRGGKLLQEEKLRKKVLKDLPKMEEEVAEFIVKQEQATGKDFHVNGLRFPQYVIRQWEDFHSNKEKEKQDRLKARAKQTQEEMMFGSKSALTTPGKRKPGAPPTTPMRTPLKARKLNSTVKTPNTTGRLLPTSRLQHSTVFHSPLFSSKTPMSSSNKRRRSKRLLQKAVEERRSSNKRRSRDIFSHTTVSSDLHSSSLASAGSYNEFTTGLLKPNCRSSVVPSTPIARR